MADPTIQKTPVLSLINQKGVDSFEGSFGHFTVVTATKSSSERGVGGTTEIGTYSKDVSIWDRLVNFFTGKLDREKNQAIIGFIATGKTKGYAEETGDLRETVEQISTLDERLDVFKKFMTGRSNATLDEKKQACEAMKMLIRDNSEYFGQTENWKSFSGEFSSWMLESGIDTDLYLKLQRLDEYVRTGTYPDDGEDFDEDSLVFVNDNDVMKVDPALVDEYGDKSGHLKSGERAVLVKPHVVGEDGGFHEIPEKEAVAEIEKLQAQAEAKAKSKAKKKEGVGAPAESGAKPAPTPMADALDDLASKVKGSDGGEHPKVTKLKELLERGEHPVVLLEKLEELHDSVKYKPKKVNAVQIAAKAIYDEGIHKPNRHDHHQLQVVDALVGMGFENIDAIRLSYPDEGNSPVKIPE